MTKIDIISGFLGAGKTTFIKKMIDEAFKGEQIVLIENEFGEVGIDGGFLKDAGIQITEMNSGCICCSLVGDFGKNLNEVITKYHPDRILIEPSGVGKLSDVMKSVIDIEKEQPVKLNALVTVVNALKASKQMKAFGEFFNNQIEYATTVILSRSQNATPEQLEFCVKQIQALNPKASVITTDWDAIKGEQILKTMEGQDNLEMKVLAEARHAQDEAEHHHHHHDHDEHEHHHEHDEHEHHHDHDEHEHHHDHDHEPGGFCPCGHDAVSGGVGHDRAMGRIFFALLGGILTVNSFLLEWALPEQAFAASISALFGAFVLALPIIITAIKDLVNGKVYMNELVALAILAALASADFQTAGIIAFFLLLTIIIETRTASGAQRSIEELIKLTPNTARKLSGDDNSEQEVQVTELKIGDRIRVRPGENFPVDARIIAGESTVNQASITGESLPVEKSVGSDVFAGTQNLTGLVDLEVTKVGEDTTLGKVKDMILQAESSRTPVVRIIDRYAGYYTPTVLMLACVTWWFTEDISRVITLMVIACPCAVVLATPTAVVAAVAAAARLGIFIKNVAHLELASKITAFVFDKTGTLTDGLLSVVKLNPFGEVTPAELLMVAGSAERYSNHPTAVAIQKLAEEAKLELDEATEFQEAPGKGVSAKINGVPCLIGRANWMNDMGVTVPEHNASETEGMSVVYVARDGKVLGWIGFKDKLRREAPAMIADLRRLGVRYCAMVTGDRQSVAESVAAQLQIDEFKSECLPEGKVEFVENVKKNSRVAVVGDGVNDAPALAEGDLGIAMGAIGSDIAINSASIALMTNDLRRIPMLVFLSRKSRMIINQNLLFGMLFVFGGMILSVFGWMTPIWAAVLHAGSTLIIIFNSARLVRTGEELTLEENLAAAETEQP